MAFWDEYEDLSGGGTWIGAPEKQVIMDNGIPMTVQSIVEDHTNQHGPRYVALVTLPNPETGEDEERKISFPIGSGVESRERMLAEMKTYLQREDAEPVVIKIEKVGKAILIRQA